jgi:hypothetical protein
MTLEIYEKILSEQGGVCAISGVAAKPGKCLCVDHDHKTGKVRGLVTRRINYWIELVENHPDQEAKLHAYLRKHHE